jgi:signal transduction histidine kinase
VSNPFSQPRAGRRSPAGTLTIGIGVALVAIGAAGAYTIGEIRQLRDDQTAIGERNRKGSLQLLRIQNDLASLAVLMRDMADRVEPYPLQGYRPAVDRVRHDLSEATALEATLAPAARDAGQQRRLLDTMERYGRDFDRMFEVSRTDEDAARRMIRTSLVPQHRELDGLVAQFLIANNRTLEEAAEANRAVYDRVARDILVLIAALLAVTAIAGGWMVRSNRRAFDEVAGISAQLRTLSWRSLRVQEEMQRSIARELHDDFGQILTAIGTLLGRARRRAADPDALATELDAVRGVAQQSLDRIRTRSRWLHPGALDDFGLVKALEHFAQEFEQQSGIRIHMSVTGPIGNPHSPIDNETIANRQSAIPIANRQSPLDNDIHVYRIAQEALSNVSRHSKSTEAWVRLTRSDTALELEIEDRGVGMPAVPETRFDRGMGLVSMRERAELMGGEFHVERPAAGGVLLRVRVPVPAAAGATSAGLQDVSSGGVRPPGATEVA